MLSEHQRELLTAFIDGEMTRRQRKNVLRLLHRSSEARAFLQLLQEDSHRLRSLPKVVPDEDLTAKIMLLIQDQTREVGAAEVQAPSPRYWRGWAAAAAVLLALGASLWYFGHLSRQPSSQPQARKQSSPAKADSVPNPLVARMAEGAIYRFVEPIIELRLAWQELREEGKQKRLAKELQRDTSFHLDVTVADNTQAIARLQETLQKSGVQVLVDQAALEAPKDQDREVLVYLENVRPEEVNRILLEFGAGQGSGQGVAAPKNAPSLVVGALSTEHRRQLSAVLGVDPAQLPPPRKGPAPLFDPPPVAGAKDQPAKEAGKEGSKEPVKDTPVLPPPVPTALVLANRPLGQGGTLTPQIQAFLAKRQHYLQPGTLQIVLVVHQARA